VTQANTVEAPPRNHVQGWFSRERLLTITLALVSLITFYVCYLITLPFLPALAWALALAIVGHPVHAWLSRKLPNENIAAVITVMLVVVILVLPGLVLIQQVIQKAVEGFESWQVQISSGNWRNILQDVPGAVPALDWILGRTDLGRQLGSAGEALARWVPTALSGFGWMTVQLLVMLFALFFFFRDARECIETVRSLVPLSRGEARRVLDRIYETILVTVHARVLMGTLQGMLSALMFWILGIPGVLLWGSVMVIASIIPVLGSFIVWIPAAIWLLVTGHWIKAIILIAWGSVVVGMVDNIVYPMVVGQRMRLHTLVIFVAIVGGLAAFGMSGLILGPVAVAIAVALIDIWKRRTAGGNTAEEAVAR
jgi:predicted PurR-regulated permease PerM